MSNKQALLLVAHGSRRQRSNDEVRELAATVAQQAGERFMHVDCAFLELAEPSIEAGIDQCVAAGAEAVVVMPYFLSAGRHVAEDVPAIVRKKQTEYPQVSLRLSAYLGAAPSISQLILDTVDSGDCLCGQQEAACRYPACVVKQLG
ncbi:MAG: CbiX/SirB N-terminal domain-containing protein [Thiolinea sp.]